MAKKERTASRVKVNSVHLGGNVDGFAGNRSAVGRCRPHSLRMAMITAEVFVIECGPRGTRMKRRGRGVHKKDTEKIASGGGSGASNVWRRRLIMRRRRRRREE